MPIGTDKLISLVFSEKHDRAYVEQYLRKHGDDLARRLSDWRDRQLTRKARQLASEPGGVLDSLCGAGRFFATLAEQPGRTVVAADYSGHMLEAAKAVQPGALRGRLEFFRTTAFAIERTDNAVDSIFCARLLRRAQQAANRLAMWRACVLRKV